MRLVIKVGTNLINQADGQVNKSFLNELVSQLSQLHQAGHDLILVTSGAVASGRSELKLKKERKTIPFRQVLAAVGQGILMNTYRDLFKDKKIIVAQVLLTEIDFKNKDNFLNTKNILELLLKEKVIPIINENDVVSYAEIKFGDNDILSAKAASLIGADKLIILTDVDGLYDKNPQLNSSAKLIPTVTAIDDTIKNYAAGPVNSQSRGGMISKISAAIYATDGGVEVIITNGRTADVLIKLISEKKSLGTYFKANRPAHDHKKKWMQNQIVKNSAIIVDDGAAQALKKRGSSLLPSGIKIVEGHFGRGDIVAVYNLKKQKIAFGQTNYSAEEISKIAGQKSDQIENCLGYAFEPEIIHRDQLVIVGIE